MQNDNLNELICSYYERIYNLSEKNRFDYDFINKLIEERGKSTLEQKFTSVINTLNNYSKNNLEPRKVYSELFPDLLPRIKTINEIFNNSTKNNSFLPLYDSSEYLYRKWLINFNTCYIMNDESKNFTINITNCKELLEEFKTWINQFPEVKGSFIKSNINWDLGVLPFNKHVVYSPKNKNVKSDILQQLEKNNTIQITDTKNNTVIEVKYSDTNIILLKKNRFAVTPINIQKWLNKLGITIALSTATYLIEFGMPYGGEMISLNEILRYTTNGHGIIGLLASKLNLLIYLSDKGEILIDSWNHPLCQSVVLGLARLEYYLNPSII